MTTTADSAARPATPHWVLVWVEPPADGGEDLVRWATSPGLAHWQLVGLLESARRATEGS
jgi:hypothetical protein